MKIKKMSDEKCLETFLELLETRLSISTGFVQDPETGNLTHQMLEIVCGDLVTSSQPEPLAVILRPALAEEQGATVN